MFNPGKELDSNEARVMAMPHEATVAALGTRRHAILDGDVFGVQIITTSSYQISVTKSLYFEGNFIDSSWRKLYFHIDCIRNLSDENSQHYYFLLHTVNLLKSLHCLYF